MKRRRRWMLLLVALFAAEGFVALGNERFAELRLEDLDAGNARLAGKRVTFEAYVLGQEYERADDADPDVWIIALGPVPTPGPAVDTVLLPRVVVKLRAAEDGFNRDIMRRCHALCRRAQRNGQPVKVFGVFVPGAAYRQYAGGVDLALSRIRVGGVELDTDFGDVSKARARTPRRIRKIYGGGKRLATFIGKLL